MNKAVLLVIAVFALLATALAGTTITPTTTLAIETGNNTSAASTFKTQSNGNLGAGNVSKEPIRSLLYAGSTTKIYVHLMGWFGGTNHMNVGYASDDAAQVARQVTDMMSRGVDGAILDWYGPNNTRSNQTAQLLRAESEKRNGKFQFAIMEDAGALKTCANTSGCDLSDRVIKDLTYAYQQFEGSSAYIRSSGRPVVFFFGTDSYSLDWPRIRANTPGNPLFIFRNSGAFAKSQSDGGFSWLGISSTDPNNMGLGYLDNFYSTALRYSNEITYGSAYKGFNDTLASWGKNRIVNQQCGQTWLATMAEAGKYYSSYKQLPNTQLVTWNDYEEATELESGIDNCVAVSGSVSGNTLSWSITGRENTIARYTVFISTDGLNLMPVAQVPAGTHRLDLAPYAFDAAAYKLYIKAIGKPSIRNQMSPAIAYSLANQPPVAKLSVSTTTGPGSVTASASTAGSVDPDGQIISTLIDFGDGATVSATSATHTYTVAGTYTLRATVTDNAGAKSTASTTVTVGSGVNIITPANNATVASPTHVVATAGSSGGAITAIRIYVDNVSVYLVNKVSKIDTYITLSTGAHRVVVQSWDSLGVVNKSTVSVTVQ